MKTIKIASHIHSAFSDDSTAALPGLVTTLKRVGYHGALVCDHDRTMTELSWYRLQDECARISQATNFILVPGIEYQDADHVVHMPVYGPVPFFGRSPNLDDLLPAVAAAGGVAVFAHPARRDAWKRFDTAWVPFLSGLEVWSRKYDGIRPNEWALEMSALLGMTPYVSLDYHGPRQLFPLSMKVRVSQHAEPEDVLRALRAGSTRPSVFGMHPEQFSSGALGAFSSGMEATRRWGAPQLRRLENARGGRPE